VTAGAGSAFSVSTFPSMYRQQVGSGSPRLSAAKSETKTSPLEDHLENTRDRKLWAMNKH
jgi:hypothetical protein